MKGTNLKLTEVLQEGLLTLNVLLFYEGDSTGEFREPQETTGK